MIIIQILLLFLVIKLPLRLILKYYLDIQVCLNFIHDDLEQNNLATKIQSTKLYTRVIIKKYRRPKLCLSPQRKVVTLRLRVCTPRKPNSARRPVIKGLVTTKKKVLAHIPGSGHNLRRHSKVLICGVGARDVPVVNYTCIRGVYDFAPLSSKKKRRSVYGVPRPAELKTHIRRKYRNLTE